ncbi:MAG: alpha-1,2-fucosyltransferase [Candidatus Saccharibacteria bacterium]
MGGLGNQMFQYAAARSLAVRRGTSVCLDLSWFSSGFDENTTPRSYELDCFNLDRQTVKLDKNSFASRLGVNFSRQYTEPHFHYDKNFSNLPKRSILEGYFQSEKYFHEVRDMLLADFEWQHDPLGKNKSLVRNISENNRSVAIHVRRGDYVSNASAADFHGLTDKAYYTSAVKKIMKIIPDANLYVFSDDPSWCRKNLKFSQKTIYISHNKTGSEDMRLMKLCRHNIIANSSFSWWGAWLNQNPNKIVIAPKKWFLHSESNTKDVIPNKWIQIG